MKTFFLYLVPLAFFCLNHFSVSKAQLSESYNLLSTVAGKGDTDGRSNDWLADYENGMATDAELSRPHMAMADLAGNIYIADKEAHAIRKVDTQGIISTVAGTNTAGDGGEGIATDQALNAPNGLWVKSDGSFYILDMNNDKIRKVDVEGNMTTIVDDPGGINLGRGLWVSQSEDTIWWSSGSLVKIWTEASGIAEYATGFSGLGNITQDPNGYVVATDRSGNRVYRIAEDGSKTVIAGNGAASGGGTEYHALESAFHGVRGISFLNEGGYLLATHEGSQIWYVDTDSIVHLFLDGREDDDSHSGDGQHFQTPGDKISEARAVSIDHQGNVLVTENDRGFIRKIDKNVVNSFISESRSDRDRLNVFPNPVRDMLSIELDSELTTNAYATIYNKLGQIVYSWEQEVRPGLNKIVRELGKLSPGTYLLTFRSGEINATRKIIVID